MKINGNETLINVYIQQNEKNNTNKSDKYIFEESKIEPVTLWR